MEKSTSVVITSDSLATDKKGKPLMKPYSSLHHLYKCVILSFASVSLPWACCVWDEPPADSCRAKKRGGGRVDKLCVSYYLHCFWLVLSSCHLS